MNELELACRAELRRGALFQQRERFNGIDFVEVAADQLSLCVHFFGAVPALADPGHPDGLTTANLRIGGGARIRGIAVLALDIDRADDAEHDSCLHVTLDKAGDFSVYTLCLVEPDLSPYRGFDPRYACTDFSFKADCPRALDCKDQAACAPAMRATPEINYLAKDYASFRQLILDRLALTMPDWRERHAPDLGITLAELLAYAADHLSYYQDAVATEAYLDTARERISVRRHARLVDYQLHEGLNARAWVCVHTSADSPLLEAGDGYFITGFPGLKTVNGNMLRASDLEGVPASLYEAFEPVLHAPVQWFAAHNEILFYTWGEAECCLPKGATRATLLDEQGALKLKIGDVLIFEEVIGPHTGRAADADPAHRHAVRLTAASASVDALLGGRRLLEIEWGRADALPFALCLSARLPAPDCTRILNLSVARGNVLLVDHGRSVHDDDAGVVGSSGSEGECACDGSLSDSSQRPTRLTIALRQAPLTFADPVGLHLAAAQAFERDVRKGQPQVTLTGLPAPDGSAADAADPRWQWVARSDLLASFGEEQHFVAEIDDSGSAHLRFGDGDMGRQPPAGMRFCAAYRVGNGVAGNVGRDAIAYLVLRKTMWDGLTLAPRNPAAARGGVAAEPVAEAKLFAPFAFRTRLQRAITADDYAVIAGADPALQRAAARLRWNGSWYEAGVGIDPLGAEQAESALLDAIGARLHPYRRIGHDLRVQQANYVPLDVELTVCVAPHYAQGTVRALLLALFSNRVLADASLGLFHPDRLGFGGAVYQSQLVAAAHGVEGVDHVELTRLQRLYQPRSDAPAPAVLPIGAMEIAQLDNDPNFPERGQLTLIMKGGR